MDRLKRITRFFLLVTVFFTTLFADDYFIREVKISGNRRTKESVILREIPFDLPGKVSQNSIQEFQDRLRNLNIFKRVNMAVKDDTLVVDVDETLTVMLLPSFHVIDRDWHKITYGLMLVDFNFQGDKIFLYTSGWLGYNRGFSISFLDDYFTSKRYMIGMNISVGKRENKNTLMDEDHHLFGVQIGKRPVLDLYLIASLGGRLVRIPDAEKVLLQLSRNSYYYHMASFQLAMDRRNYQVYPTRGYLFLAGIYTESRIPFRFRYRHYIVDMRKYLSLGEDVALSGRVYYHGATQKLPFYDGVYLGYDERIRGYFSYTLNSRHLMEFFGEFRFPLLKRRYTDLPAPTPSLERWLSNLEYGISAAIFVDRASYAGSIGKFTTTNSFWGYGGSLYVHLPYNNLLRIDVAINDQGVRELILENRVSF